MTIYAVANGKGGVGKSTTAAQLMVTLVRMGRSVIGLDFDEQANLTRRVGVRDTTPVYGNTAELIAAEATLDEAATDAPALPGASIIVGSHQLAELTVQKVPDLATGMRDYLHGTTLAWDDVVIDTPPSLSGVAQTALVAADVVIGPTTMQWDAAEQLARLDEVLRHQIGKRMRPGAQLDWIVPTSYDARQILSRDVLASLTETYGPKVTTPVRHSVDVGKSYEAHLPVSLYAPRAPVSWDYEDALSVIVRHELAKGDQ